MQNRRLKVNGRPGALQSTTHASGYFGATLHLPANNRIETLEEHYNKTKYTVHVQLAIWFRRVIK